MDPLQLSIAALVMYLVLLLLELLLRRIEHCGPVSKSKAAGQGGAIEDADPVFLRHLEEVEWPPGISIYDVSEGGRIARRVPLNQVQAIENDNFVGQLVWMARPTHCKQIERSGYKYKWHFAKKSRTWEIRLQGRFKTKPRGSLQAGVVLRDYDYSLPLHKHTRFLLSMLVPILERAVKQRLHMAWGDRGESSTAEDPELLCLVGGMFVTYA